MKAKGPVIKDFPAQFRAMLEAELAELEGLLAVTSEDSAIVTLDQQQSGRLSRISDMQSQAMAQATRHRRAARQQKIHAALKRMDEGEYGWCAECGDFIGEGRLKIDPTFHLCVKCAEGS